MINEIKSEYKKLYKLRPRCESWEDFSKVYSDIVFELAKQFKVKCRVVRDICCEVDSNYDRR